MKPRVVLVAAATAVLSLLPVLYLRLVWPSVPAWVATHSTGGVADHFAARGALWNVIWWPALAFVALTCWPQVHDGESLFWSSPRQRQVRAVVVAALAAAMMAGVHHSIGLGTNTLPLGR